MDKVDSVDDATSRWQDDSATLSETRYLLLESD